MDECVVLNDGETYTDIDRTVVVDRHGIAYDLAAIFHRIPIQIRERCRIGLAEDVVPKFCREYNMNEDWP